VGGARHSRQGVRGNEEADMVARREVELGWRLQKAVVATPAGIKQEFPIYPKAPAHLAGRAQRSGLALPPGWEAV